MAIPWVLQQRLYWHNLRVTGWYHINIASEIPSASEGNRYRSYHGVSVEHLVLCLFLLGGSSGVVCSHLSRATIFLAEGPYLLHQWCTCDFPYLYKLINLATQVQHCLLPALAVGWMASKLLFAEDHYSHCQVGCSLRRKGQEVAMLFIWEGGGGTQVFCLPCKYSRQMHAHLVD